MTLPRSLRRCLPVSLLLLACFSAIAGADPRPRDILRADEIKLALDKLGNMGTALYVGAHPDDENTAMLTWLSQGRKVRTIYLSVTRGDGGQNLIGSDTGERLGVLRTQELLAARRIDGAEQRFTRAVDFGFSKNSDETLKLWDHDRALEDVVWVIRRLHPDVIITRFPPDSTAGHGHHAASAILAAEAFRAAADSTRFKEQLLWLRPWQAKRLMWNVFRGGSGDTTRGRLNVDLGAYDPRLGESYSELAARSRSMHKTQGFGAAERRGSFTNTLLFRDGEPPVNDLFDGVAMTWDRVEHGDYVGKLVAQAQKEYDPEHPERSLAVLLRINGVLVVMGDDPLMMQKRAEVYELIRSVAGLWLEGIASSATVSPGGHLKIAATALARASSSLVLERVELLKYGLSIEKLAQRRGYRPLVPNQAISDTFELDLPKDLTTSQPYWLRRPQVGSSYEIDDDRMTGVAENLPALMVRFIVNSGAEHIQYEVPVVYRWVDPVAGERYRALDVIPPVTLSFPRETYLFPDAKPRAVAVVVHPGDQPLDGHVVLDLPLGWSSKPLRVPMRVAAGQSDTMVTFQVTPAAGPAAGTVGAAFELETGTRWNKQLVTLDYPHLPMQVLLPNTSAHLIRAPIRVTGREIGYIMGSGDQVPAALTEMGLTVTLLDDAQVEFGDLSRFKVIVTGVRAFNTRPRVVAQRRRLLDWVAAGGRLVVQYNTVNNAFDIGPKPFRISGERVTVEDAPVTLLKPAHPFFNTPNKIGPDDFNGWVQERGLNFATTWDPAYEPLLSAHDPKEPPRNGGMLVARHGKGTFVYTGYSWFRQLPAGVPGAWRLFANLVSAP